MLHIYIYIYLTTYVVKHYATTFQQQHINNQHAGAVIRRSPTSPASGWTSCSSRWYNQCPRPDRGGGDGCTSPASPSACWHPPPFSAHTRWDDFSEIYWPVFVFLPWWAPDCPCALPGPLRQLCECFLLPLMSSGLYLCTLWITVPALDCFLLPWWAPDSLWALHGSLCLLTLMSSGLSLCTPWTTVPTVA